MNVKIITLLLNIPLANGFLLSRNAPVNTPRLQISLPDFFSPFKSPDKSNSGIAEYENKLALLELLKTVPPNEATPKDLSLDILNAVQVLESTCPTADSDVIPSLAGNWELIWTAQDTQVKQSNPFSTWINPLENQSYSNKPIGTSGRSNPILPQNMQNNLEEIGILTDRLENAIVSTQAIDLKRNRVRNVVSFEVNNPTNIFSSNGKTKGRIIVDVKCTPNIEDNRKIDVKFDSCRVTLLDSPIDITFPLGIIGPTGWLRTVYIDADIRITRGHKGSVFILSRTGRT